MLREENATSNGHAHYIKEMEHVGKCQKQDLMSRGKRGVNLRKERHRVNDRGEKGWMK